MIELINNQMESECAANGTDWTNCVYRIAKLSSIGPEAL